MNSNVNKKIKEAFKVAFSEVDSKDELEHESKMIMYRFLSEIERISEENGLNRKDLATLIGTSASFLTQLFRGNKLINLPTLAKFQKVFDFTFEIKAVSNNEEEVFLPINIDNICKPQYDTTGYWTFHKNNPSYNNNELSEGKHTSPNFEKQTA
jgi:transcriptional regulator with XRE-family HTH domain